MGRAPDEPAREMETKMTDLLRKSLMGCVTALSLGAMVAASATPAAADWHGRRGWGGGGGGAVAAGIIGGLALGAIAAGASRHAYAAPVYEAPAPVYVPGTSYYAESY